MPSPPFVPCELNDRPAGTTKSGGYRTQIGADFLLTMFSVLVDHRTSTRLFTGVHCVEAEVLAVQHMTQSLRSSGMDEAQSNAMVQAIAKGMQTFGVTREVLREELAPINERIGRLEAKFDQLSARMLYLMLAVLAAITGMLGTMAAVIWSGGG